MDYPIELHDEHKDLLLAPIHDKPLLPTSKYWLKKYIGLNTELRKKATNEFSKNFYKFLNNSVFGKLMEDARKHRDVRIVTKLKGCYGAEALITKPNFSGSYIIGDLAIIEMRRLKIILNKPIYLGFNSFILGVTRYNIYEYMKRDWEKFDTSEYSPANPWDIRQHNKKVVGLMKDETNGDILLEFIGLRAKMYAYRVQRDKKSYGSRAKSVKGSALGTITFDDYKNCLLNNVNIDRIQRTIQSKKHEVKTSLSAGDDKRHLIEDSTDTLPWGYKEVFVDEPMKIE
ncbi:uncharacterized protein LOC122850478 [Aphidius gifuensis]|uniref:uncharacterized protein LOC122850478 n=1 Tax=Aphidius gifuensis TaxID=684658 RepID=UPI001CDD141B|nr:uncharacterized protein LOC122850478 [Aphidius gifuensis]